MIREEFVTFESAKLLKEAGFPQDNLYLTDGPKTDDPLYVWYDNRGRTNLRPIEDQVYWNAPTQAQAMRWLREKHEISVEPHVTLDKQWMCNAWDFDTIANCVDEEMRFPTYEAAAEAAIQAACEYLIEEGDKQ